MLFTAKQDPYIPVAIFFVAIYNSEVFFQISILIYNAFLDETNWTPRFSKSPRSRLENFQVFSYNLEFVVGTWSFSSLQPDPETMISYHGSFRR